MEKVLFCFFDETVLPIVRHKKLLACHEVYLISEKMIGCEKRDISFLDNSESLGLEVYPKEQFDFFVDQCDHVIFQKIEDCNFAAFLKALDKKKKITILEYDLRLDKEKQEKIRLAVQCKLALLCPQKTNQENLLYDNHLYQMDVPVILISRIDYGSNQFELELALRSRFLEQGYRVSQIGSRVESFLFNMHPFPFDIFKNGKNEGEKILMFNHLIKKIELEERPNVFILAVPENLVHYEHDFKSNFNIVSYEVSHAVKADYVYMCLPCGDYTKEALESIRNLAEFKFNWPIDKFSISNTLYSAVGGIDEERDFLKLPVSEVDQKIADVFHQQGIQMVNVLSKASVDEAYETMLNELSANHENEIF